MKCYQNGMIGGVLFVAIFIAGCGGTDDKKDPKAGGGKPENPAHKDDHPTKGPHGGDLIELGEHEYHAELTHDHEKHTVTIYLLDKDIKKSVPIADKEITLNLILKDKSTKQYKLPAKPQTDDPAGQSSRFELADEKLVDVLEEEETQGRLPVKINGKDYVGDVKHVH